MTSNFTTQQIREIVDLIKYHSKNEFPKSGFTWSSFAQYYADNYAGHTSDHEVIWDTPIADGVRTLMYKAFDAGRKTRGIGFMGFNL